MRTRVCTKCGEEKPETTGYFYRSKTSRGGINTMCKSCTKEQSRRYYAENSEKVREASRRWKAENPEKVRESNRRWRAKNPEKAREARRRWQAGNHEKVREVDKRWRAENPEKVREKDRRYINSLAPTYLKTLISAKYDIDRSEIGDELIEAKRREITYHRQLKQFKQLKK